MNIVIVYTNTFPQSQDLFHACLGFASQLSQIYCKLEVKLGDKFFLSFETVSPGNLLGKRKSAHDYKRNLRK